jgi:hypothetical protein
MLRRDFFAAVAGAATLPLALTTKGPFGDAQSVRGTAIDPADYDGPLPEREQRMMEAWRSWKDRQFAALIREG